MEWEGNGCFGAVIWDFEWGRGLRLKPGPGRVGQGLGGVIGEGAGDGGMDSRLGIMLRLHLLFVGLRVRLAKKNDAE